MDSFGQNLRISIFGESHSPEIGVEMTGVPAGMTLCVEDFAADIDRRRSTSAYTTARKEEDIPIIRSGVTNGATDGNPLRIVFRNENIRPQDYESLGFPRPGHADFVSSVKYGKVSTGGGKFSGRMTLPLVAAGVVAKKMLPQCSFNAEILEIGGMPFLAKGPLKIILEKAASEGDSVGGIVECRIDGVPVGVGEPFFDSVESVISHLVFSIPGVRGIEFGEGFGAARSRGSKHNDCYTDSFGHTATNNCGGINGGIANGNQIVFRVAFKPTSSISRPQMSYNPSQGRVAEVSVKGRHDVCFCLRTPVIVEAVAALAIAELWIEQFPLQHR